MSQDELEGDVRAVFESIDVEALASVILGHEFRGVRVIRADVYERTCRCGHVITFMGKYSLESHHTRDEAMAHHQATAIKARLLSEGGE
jgi:hypothetical protein